MVHKYEINGMTCSGCMAKIKSELLKLPDILSVDIDLALNEATVKMQKHISVAELQHALSNAGAKYFIKEKKNGSSYEVSGKTASTNLSDTGVGQEEDKTWFQTYKPVLLLFGMITLISVVVAISDNGFNWMNTMRIFMSGFFLSFSFFKFLDLKGFADSYTSYDIVAKRWRGWGYIYAFIELTLGLLYAINIEPLTTNIITLIVMSISIVGVLQSVLNNKKIKCACLGTVFNLPMSTVTIIEDAMMIAMSAMMVIMML